MFSCGGQPSLLWRDACYCWPAVVVLGSHRQMIRRRYLPSSTGSTIHRARILMIQRHTRRDRHKTSTPPEVMIMDPLHRPCRCREQTRTTSKPRGAWHPLLGSRHVSQRQLNTTRSPAAPLPYPRTLLKPGASRASRLAARKRANSERTMNEQTRRELF
jgi:hypothetical protein